MKNNLFKGFPFPQKIISSLHKSISRFFLVLHTSFGYKQVTRLSSRGGLGLRGESDDNVQTQLPLLSRWIESRLRHGTR